MTDYSKLREEIQTHLTFDFDENGVTIPITELLDFKYLNYLTNNFDHITEEPVNELKTDRQFYQIIISNVSNIPTSNKDKKEFKNQLDYYNKCNKFRSEFSKIIKLNINKTVFEKILTSDLNHTKLLLLAGLIYNLSNNHIEFTLSQSLLTTIVSSNNIHKYKQWFEDNDIIINVPYNNENVRSSKINGLAERFMLNSNYTYTSTIKCNYTRFFDTWINKRIQSSKAKFNVSQIGSVLPKDSNFIKVIIEEYYKYKYTSKKLEKKLYSIDKQLKNFINIISSPEDIIFTNDKYGFRKHSPLTQLNKILRQSLTYKNTPLFELDLTAAQPSLIAKIAYEHDKNSKDEYNKFLNLLSNDDSLSNEQNDFYMKIARMINKDEDEILTRADIKNDLLQYLMCSRDDAFKCYNRMFNFMKTEFNFIHRYLCFIQQDRKMKYKKSSLLLQRAETKIMTPLFKIIKESNVLFTIHDAIFLDKETMMKYKDELIKEVNSQNISCTIESYDYKKQYKIIL